MKNTAAKRVLSLFLAIILALGTLCLPAVAAELRPSDAACPRCGSKNRAERIDEPTCTKSGACIWYCLDCGLETTMVGGSFNAYHKDALGHNYVDGICTRCGVRDSNYQATSETPAGGSGTASGNGSESSGSGSGTSETDGPGNSGSGSGTSETDGPGNGSTGSTESTGGNESVHSHSWYYDTESATCAKEGRWFRVCRTCGEEETLRVYEKQAHSYRSEVVRQATAEQDGLRRYTCSRCGDSYTEAIPKTGNSGTGNIPSTGETVCTAHQWNYSTVRATCTEEGKYIRTCRLCGFSEVYSTVPASGHRYSEKVTRAATADLEGIKTYTCTVCGSSYTETIEKLPQAEAALKTGLRDSGSSSMKKLSQAEITKLLAGAPHTKDSSPFVTMPSSSAPYSPGTVKPAALQEAVNRLNALRRIAGLPEVRLDTSLCENAQYGAVILEAIGRLDHHPAKPADMDDDFYKKAYSATSSSNLSSGSTLTGAVDSFMDDSDSSNIDRLGHRRWQLNPTMGKVGFGRAGYYTVEKVFDRSGSGCDYDFISWPASGSFPTELFRGSTAWSVTLNPQQYDTSKLSGITVTMTRESDGKTWTMRSGGGDGYFNVDLAGYGVSNCIVFRPNGISGYDGTYTVRISGLKAKNGQAVNDFTYKVDFFGGTSASQNPARNPSQNPTQNTTQPDTTVPNTNGTTTGSQSGAFRDVPASHWAGTAIQEAVKAGIVNGYQDGTFKPAASVTSAHFNAMMARAFFSDDLKTAQTDSNWWTPNVLTNESHGILKGTKLEAQHQASGAYGSQLNTAISRYDMAQMMYNILKDRGVTMPSAAQKQQAQSAMKDWNSVPAGYREAVTVCYALGLLNGQNDGSFGGQNSMNRAQGCVVIGRLSQHLKRGGIQETPASQSGTQGNTQQTTSGQTGGQVGALVNDATRNLKVPQPSTGMWTGWQGRAYGAAVDSDADVPGVLKRCMDGYPSTIVLFSQEKLTLDCFKLFEQYEISHGLHSRTKSICYTKTTFVPKGSSGTSSRQAAGNYYEYRIDLGYDAAGYVRMYREGIISSLPTTTDYLYGENDPADYTLLLNAVKQIERTYGISDSSSDYEKALACYRWVTENISYDRYMASLTGNDLVEYVESAAYPSEINFALTNYKGVCFEYALLYQALCCAMKVNCIVVCGRAGGMHAWNMVQIDGQWYQADPTWDAGDAPERYQYFLVSDTVMRSRVIEQEGYQIPSCPENYRQ